MKKILFLFAVLAVTLASCDTKSKPKMSDDEPTTADSLREALANQDSLLALFNEISADMMSIKEMEQILANPATMKAESVSKREHIKNDMAAIQEALQQRREKIEELEKKLRNSNANNKILQTTIDNLKAQILQQDSAIRYYQEALEQRRIIILAQSERIEDLTQDLSAVSEAKNQAEEKNLQLTEELNTCYYAIGTKKELKAHNLIESGFLRKTKILPGEIDLSFFHQGDKRTLKTINLYSKKAKVVTDQPKSSYSITQEANGEKVLNILDSKIFWEKGNFLVIQID
ncbi:MAG: hypothetical protein J1E99_05465 [Muribaculaceae bacterium]|nr:hypothetical protein [Muribaculaceae bacterium]